MRARPSCSQVADGLTSSSMSVYGQISWKRCSGCAASRRVTYLGTWQATQLAW
ncbi:Uncharacterised protein [Bordetella pertussis]|nr:Uncharacterised protein [Bordetella pertussis]